MNEFEYEVAIKKEETKQKIVRSCFWILFWIVFIGGLVISDMVAK